MQEEKKEREETCVQTRKHKNLKIFIATIFLRDLYI